VNIKVLKIVLGLFLFIFFLAPVLNHDNLDLEQQEINEKLALEKIAEKRAYLTGRFDQTKHEDFVVISEQYSMGGNKMYLRKEAYADFIKMRKAASRDGINLLIASATRNFDYQRGLWNRKWSGASLVEGKNLSVSISSELERFNKILEYSAAPSTSRHHWGTDIDINGAEPAYFDTPKGIAEYEWLTKNAKEYGFCQTYTAKGEERLSGYNEEKWHWTYTPLSRNFTKEYQTIVMEADIYGFSGEAQVPTLNLIENYVLAINPDCL